MPIQDADDKMTGTVFNVQKLSIHDGPGIRTTVFFKGCPLSCIWCSNPESQKSGAEIACLVSRCIKCGCCTKACPEEIIENSFPFAIINRQSCTLCMACVDECCTGAKKVVGKSYTAKELYEEILQDRQFYSSSGGGVTFSGGEPFIQADFLIRMLKACNKGGIHTAVETTGMVSLSTFLEAAEYIDLIFFDLKHMDDEKHMALTGVSNRQILKNLDAVSRVHGNITVRMPVIPGLNDDLENVRKIGDYAAGLSVPHLELLPYHNFGSGKYAQIGRSYSLAELKSPSPAHMENLADAARTAVGARSTVVSVMSSE